MAGKTLLVVTHGNTLRALVKRLDDISEEGSYYLDMPTATPLLYEFTEGMEHVQAHGCWGDRPESVRHRRFQPCRGDTWHAQIGRAHV